MSIHEGVIAGGTLAHALPLWIGPRPVKSGWSHLVVVLGVVNTHRVFKISVAVLESVKYWTGIHKVEMKPSEWLVVLIGVAVGIIILHLSPAATPFAATLAPQSLPISESSAPSNRTGQEWECLIVEDNDHQVNLVCDKKDGDSPQLVRLGSKEDGP